MRNVRRQRGFTLIEILAAITVFSIVTLGLVPLLAASMRGTSLAQSETVAQNAAREAMERIQGLKWFTSWNVAPTKVDALDLFYPRASTSGLLPGQSYGTVSSYPPLTVAGGAGGIFTTNCPNGGNPACYGNVPPGYSLKIEAAFVKANAGTTPQTYQVVTPPSDYASDSSTGKDTPPAQLMYVSVAVTRTVSGQPRTSKLHTIIGDKKFAPPPAVVGTAAPSPTPGAVSGPAKIDATAKLDYVYQVQTGFSSSNAGTGCATPPCASDFQATMLTGESTIQSSDTVTADSSVQTADVRLVRAYPSPQSPPASPPPDLASFTGITGAAHAPPTVAVPAACSPAPPSCTTNTALTHPDFSNATIATIGGTKITAISADTPAGNPTTSAAFQLNQTPCGTTDASYVHPQADHSGATSSAGYLKLDSVTTPINHVRTMSGSSCLSNPAHRTRGTVAAHATALTPASSRFVQSTATATIQQLGFLKLGYPTSGTARPLMFNLFFSSSVDCKAVPNGAAYANGTWTGHLAYRADNNNNGSSVLSAFTATMNAGTGNDTITGAFSGTTTSTISVPNAIDWMRANNPLVWDGSNGCVTVGCDIFMFAERDSSGVLIKKGYLNSAHETKVLPRYVSADGREVRVAIDAALRFDTHQLHASQPDSSYSIAVGKMSCEAIDNR